jgi:hypothetical protein
LNCWVTETNDTWCLSNVCITRAKSINERERRASAALARDSLGERTRRTPVVNRCEHW